jgi:hypothetical protein
MFAGVTNMEIVKSQLLETGMLERRFRVEGAGGRPVPGVLWTGVGASEPSPLILVGHGGGASKTAERVLEHRDYFTGCLGIAVAAIDGPVHGDRGGLTTTDDPRYREMWRSPTVIDDMSADWARALDALLALGDLNPLAVAYHGLSMGSMFGIPYVASDQRIVAAVLGKCGLRGSSIDRSGIAPRLAADAGKITCPILFHVQWDDERFDRDSALELFGLIGTPDKRLQSIPGPHAGASPESTETIRRFLANRLLVVSGASVP